MLQTRQLSALIKSDDQWRRQDVVQGNWRNYMELFCDT